MLLLPIKVTIVLAVAGLLNTLLRKAPASLRHLVWLTALGGVFLLPLLSLMLPSLPFEMAYPGQGLIEITQTFTLGGTHPASFNWLTSVIGCWFVGVIVGIIRAVYSARAMRTVARNSRPFHDAECRVALLISSEETMPLVFGLLRPAVILPASAANWTENMRRMVLLHELAHIQRRDLWSQALARFVTIVYWFHPLVWLTGHRLKVESELACDESVLLSGVIPSDYAAGLLDVARSLQWRKSWSGSALAMARHSHLEGRVRAILHGARRASAKGKAAVWFMLLTILPAAALQPGADAGSPAPVRWASEIPAPAIIFRPHPVYPESAKRRGIAGIVRIRALIGRDGSIKELFCLSAPDDSLKDAALEAVRRWRYQPIPAESYSVININFSLSK